jgi:hypothetical protein
MDTGRFVEGSSAVTPFSASDAMTLAMCSWETCDPVGYIKWRVCSSGEGGDCKGVGKSKFKNTSQIQRSEQITPSAAV